jgi:hypothetical protein
MYNVELHGARRSGHDAGMAVGFWDMFFDSDYRQRSDINELRDQLATAADHSQVVAATSTMARQIQDLSVLVSMLVRMLEESGHVDGKVLRYRVEAELDNMRAARESFGATSMSEALRAGGSSASSSPVEAPPPTTPTLCTKCKKTVPANRTTITADGVVCDQCAG